LEGLAGERLGLDLRDAAAATGDAARFSRRAIFASQSQGDDGGLGITPRFRARRRWRRAVSLSRMHGEPEFWDGDRKRRRGYDHLGDGRDAEGEGRRGYPGRAGRAHRDGFRPRHRRDARRRTQARGRARRYRQRAPQARIRQIARLGPGAGRLRPQRSGFPRRAGNDDDPSGAGRVARLARPARNCNASPMYMSRPISK
jgi:hypothetical protein